MLYRIVNIETQFLEVRYHHILRILVLALIAEGLALDVAEVGGLVVFQLNDTDHFLVSQYSAICFLGIGLVFLLRNEVEVWRGVERIPKDLHEQFPQESFLELLLFAWSNILLYLLVQEISLIHFPRGCYLIGIERREVLLNDAILKEHSINY